MDFANIFQVMTKPENFMAMAKAAAVGFMTPPGGPAGAALGVSKSVMGNPALMAEMTGAAAKDMAASGNAQSDTSPEEMVKNFFNPKGPFMSMLSCGLKGAKQSTPADIKVDPELQKEFEQMFKKGLGMLRDLLNAPTPGPGQAEANTPAKKMSGMLQNFMGKTPAPGSGMGDLASTVGPVLEGAAKLAGTFMKLGMH